MPNNYKLKYRKYYDTIEEYCGNNGFKPIIVVDKLLLCSTDKNKYVICSYDKIENEYRFFNYKEVSLEKGINKLKKLLKEK